MTAFVAHREEIDLRTWAEAHPTACFRRFTVERVGDTESPISSSTTFEYVSETYEIVVAYPDDRRQRDRHGLHARIADDLHYLNYHVGTSGFATAPTGATIVSGQWRREDGAGVVFGVIPLTVYYPRGVP